MAFLPLLGAAAAGAGAAAAGASVLTAVSVAGTVLGGISQIQQARVQAQIARNNYQRAIRNAVSESTAAQEKQKRSDIEYAAEMGQQFAAQGASGLDILGASQLRTRETTRRTGRQAAIDIRRQGEAGVQSYLSDAENFHLAGKDAAAQATLALGEMTLGLGRAVGKDPKLSKSLIGSARSVRRKLF